MPGLGFPAEERREAGPRLIEQGRRVPICVIGEESDCIRLVRAGIDSETSQVRGDDLRREALAEREDEIPRAWGRLLRVRDPIEKPLEFRREGPDRLDARILAGVGQEGEMLFVSWFRLLWVTPPRYNP